MSAPSSPRKGSVHSSPVRAPRRRPSATASSPSSRTADRGARSAQLYDSIDEMDDQNDAAYDQDLDADGEYDDDYLDHDAQGQEEEVVVATVPSAPTRSGRERRTSENPTDSTPRQSSRPKRSRAPHGSYYDLPPLPSFSDAEDDDSEDEAPSIRKRPRRAEVLTSDAESEQSSHHRSDAPGATNSKVAEDEGQSAQPPVELSEEEKQKAREDKEQHELAARWTDEYFEIVEQLPLEVHRAFALMRELEGQMHTRVTGMVHDIATYHHARLAHPSTASSSTSRSQKAGSEDEAETLLGAPLPCPDDGDAGMMDKAERMDLLRGISSAANESVKAAEEKMGLAATAYEWIDRHIRRLDGDIVKLEASILLGLRSGTQESRGAREALGLALDDPGPVVADPVVSVAESAALTKAAGARRGRTRSRSNTTTPKQRTTSLPSPSPQPAVPGQPTRKRGGRRKPRPSTGRRKTTLADPVVVRPDVSDMPDDPTEPRYCYCDQISFDQMVACDNDDCPIEWFHYACVGLDQQPKAEWFCRFCAPPNWKGPGMLVPPNAKHLPPPPNKR
ncbi:hypothetical protein L1887_56135 [Cichorium endivia]|nr:hypothetical protein L1887_56135 [Cichorium endivia]